jgi:hypothetical protein
VVHKLEDCKLAKKENQQASLAANQIVIEGFGDDYEDDDEDLEE